MNHRGRGWRWGARPAIVALLSVIVGYFANVVSAGNHSVAAVAGFVCAAVMFLTLTWWDSTAQAGPKIAGQSIAVDQKIGTARDSSVIAVETDRKISGDYDLRQRVDLAERSDITGIRQAPPRSS